MKSISLKAIEPALEPFEIIDPQLRNAYIGDTLKEKNSQLIVWNTVNKNTELCDTPVLINSI